MDAGLRARRARLITPRPTWLLALLLGCGLSASARAAPGGWREAIARLSQGDEPPEIRADLEDLLATETDPNVVTGISRLLWARGAAYDRPFTARLSALRVEQRRLDPELAPDLFRLFARTRTGDLPEDPDLFERALRVLVQLPPEAVERGLRQGLMPEMCALAHPQLLRRWGEAATSAGSPELLERLRSWPKTHAAVWEALHAELTQGLLEAWELHGSELVGAMTTEGGSLANEINTRVEVALLSAWIRDDRPELARIGLDLVADKGLARAGVTQAVAAVVAGGGPNAARAAQVARSLGEGVADPPLAPPLARPGWSDGAQLVAPVELPEAALHLAWGPRDPSPDRGRFWLGSGLALVGLAALGRRRRVLAGLGVGLGCLLVAEGVLRLTNAPLLANERPLFRFADYQLELFHPVTLGGAPWLQTQGGSTRFQQIQANPTEEPFRIAALGASSVHGSHYLAEEAFPALLQERLADHPRRVEVLNLGIGGTTSAGVLQAGRQALDLGADALVVYYGHNEVAQFTRLALYEQTGPTRIWLRMLLGHSALYSGLAMLIDPGRMSVGRANGSIYADRPPSRGEVEKLKALAVDNLTSNLGRLMDLAAEAQVPVVLMRPATNYRFAFLEPYEEAGPGDAEDLQRRTQAAEARARAGPPVAARAGWLGALVASKSPREITGPALAALDQLAVTYQCTMVDVPRLFYARSQDGLGVNGLFWDDLHPTRAGHELIAGALEEAVRPLLRP